MTTVIYAGPASVDLTGIRAGDRNQFAVTLQQKGAPVDLSGLTVAAQARARASDVDPAITAVCTVTDAPNGEFTMAWPGEAVRALMTGTQTTWKGVWDLQLGADGENAQTVVAGKFTVDLDVTR